MKKVICEECKEETKRKYLGKIRGVYLCRKCRGEVRKNRREETIDKAGIREDLEELRLKADREYRKKRYVSIKKIKSPPKPKGSTYKKAREKSNCYLTKEERQNLFRILIRKGFSGEDANERIKNLQKSQTELRQKLKQENKTNEEIKIKQQELLERLWRS